MQQRPDSKINVIATDTDFLSDIPQPVSDIIPAEFTQRRQCLSAVWRLSSKLLHDLAKTSIRRRRFVHIAENEDCERLIERLGPDFLPHFEPLEEQIMVATVEPRPTDRREENTRSDAVVKGLSDCSSRGFRRSKLPFYLVCKMAYQARY